MSTKLPQPAPPNGHQSPPKPLQIHQLEQSSGPTDIRSKKVVDFLTRLECVCMTAEELAEVGLDPQGLGIEWLVAWEQDDEPTYWVLTPLALERLGLVVAENAREDARYFRRDAATPPARIYPERPTGRRRAYVDLDQLPANPEAESTPGPSLWGTQLPWHI